jgi:hypothetical protein
MKIDGILGSRGNPAANQVTRERGKQMEFKSQCWPSVEVPVSDWVSFAIAQTEEMDDSAVNREGTIVFAWGYMLQWAAHDAQRLLHVRRIWCVNKSHHVITPHFADGLLFVVAVRVVHMHGRIPSCFCLHEFRA